MSSWFVINFPKFASRLAECVSRFGRNCFFNCLCNGFLGVKTAQLHYCRTYIGEPPGCWCWYPINVRSVSVIKRYFSSLSASNSAVLLGSITIPACFYEGFNVFVIGYGGRPTVEQMNVAWSTSSWWSQSIDLLIPTAFQALKPLIVEIGCLQNRPTHFRKWWSFAHM
jgi:hypothetical protein